MHINEVILISSQGRKRCNITFIFCYLANFRQLKSAYPKSEPQLLKKRYEEEHNFYGEKTYVLVNHERTTIVISAGTHWHNQSVQTQTRLLIEVCTVRHSVDSFKRFLMGNALIKLVIYKFQIYASKN